MPNWCENDLVVEGRVKRLKEFREKLHSTNHYGEETWLDEELLIPYPEEFRRLDEAARQYDKDHPEDWKNRPKDGFNSGGYEWCIKSWGTKWGFGRVEKPRLDGEDDNEEGKLEYHFDTAWSPPLPLVQKMGELFPDLEFDLRYFEGGGGFNGMFRMEGGEIVADQSGDYFGARGG